jgi:hypothetical protein
MFGDLFYSNYVAAKTAQDAAIYLGADEEEVHQLNDESSFRVWFDDDPADLPLGERAEPHDDGRWQWVTTAANAAKYYGEGRVLSEDGG